MFLVGLDEVQSMLHKRRLGPKGVKVFKKFENQTSKADWEDVKVWRMSMCGLGGCQGVEDVKVWRMSV